MDQFKENIKNSFSAARADADGIKNDMTALKENITEWFKYFEERDAAMQTKIDNLQKRVADLETDKIKQSMDDEGKLFQLNF